MEKHYREYEMLDFTPEPIRERNGYYLFLGTSGVGTEYHAIADIPGASYADFVLHDSVKLVVLEWNQLTGDNLEGWECAWEPDYTAFGRLGRLVEDIEAQHAQKVCNHDGPCQHISSYWNFLNDHEDDRESFETYFRSFFPGNIFSALSDIEKHPENWISEENMRDWEENYRPG